MNTAPVVPFYFQSNPIRTITIDDQPWFVAADVCAALGLDNITMALQRVPENHKGVNRIDTPGGKQQANTISEPGLYRLVLRSDKPQAEPFMEWITAEVLPAIRKTGRYSFDEDDFFVPTTGGPATVTVPRLEEAARGVKAAMIMARAYGWRNDQARQYTNRLVKDITGIDTLALLDIPEPPASESSLPGELRQGVERIVGEYLQDRCDLGAPGKVSSKAMYDDFIAWFAEHHPGAAPPPHPIFGAAMGAYCHRGKNNHERFYTGVAFKEMEVAQ